MFQDIENSGVYKEPQENFGLVIDNLTLPSDDEGGEHCSDDDFFQLED